MVAGSCDGGFMHGRHGRVRVIGGIVGSMPWLSEQGTRAAAGRCSKGRQHSLVPIDCLSRSCLGDAVVALVTLVTCRLFATSLLGCYALMQMIGACSVQHGQGVRSLTVVEVWQGASGVDDELDVDDPGSCSLHPLGLAIPVVVLLAVLVPLPSTVSW
jgi:hypothetical protein